MNMKKLAFEELGQWATEDNKVFEKIIVLDQGYSKRSIFRNSL